MFNFFRKNWKTLLPEFILKDISSIDIAYTEIGKRKAFFKLSNQEVANLIISSKFGMVSNIKSVHRELIKNEPGKNDEYYAKKVLDDRLLKLMMGVLTLSNAGQLTKSAKELSQYINDNVEIMLEKAIDLDSVIVMSEHLWKFSSNSPRADGIIKQFDQILLKGQSSS